jgi:hypothetical protein
MTASPVYRKTYKSDEHRLGGVRDIIEYDAYDTGG